MTIRRLRAVARTGCEWADEHAGLFFLTYVVLLFANGVWCTVRKMAAAPPIEGPEVWHPLFGLFLAVQHCWLLAERRRLWGRKRRTPTPSRN